MGVVYKARDSHLHRFVALKVLPSEKTTDPERTRRFVQEARAASALNHPNIVTVYDIDQTEGVDFIAMEYVEGKTLEKAIGRKGLNLSEALRYAIQIADALSRAHAAGIVHRDLKPGNIMVNDHGQIKVLDFGLAKLTERLGVADDDSTRTEPQSTETGVIVGTAGYMSPEQIEGKKVDARSDIFSFGAVLYEMLAGRRAFKRDTPALTMAAVLNMEPPPLGADVPRDLARVLDRCLRKDVDRRYQHMDDVRIALEELKEESDSGKLAPQARPRPKGINWKWAAGGSLTLLLAAGAWIFREALFQPEAPLEAALLTSLPGDTRDPAFSPDGRQVAFSWNGEKQDKQAIYLKLIGSPTPRQLSSGPGSDDSPAFSPDGLSIAFCRWTPGKMAIMIMPAIGGPERTLRESPIPAHARWLSAPYLAWFPDGKNLATFYTGGLGVVSVETGDVRPLTTRGTGLDLNPAVSPDGQRLAFVRTVNAVAGPIYVLELTEDLRPKGEPRSVTPENTTGRQPAWTPDGKRLVFTSDGLWVAAASGLSPPRRLPFADAGISSPAMPRRGSRLVYRRLISNTNIWRSPLTGPEAERVPQRLISSTRTERVPAFSPDGKRIAFSSSRTGREGIWVSDADGSNAVELYAPPDGAASNPCWSPDGARIAFDLQSGGRLAIHTIPSRGGKPVRLEAAADGFVPKWSRDGAWIYFSRGTASLQLWTAPADGGPAKQVTTNGGHAASESVDGKFIYRTKSPTGSALWRTPVEGGEETQVLPALFNWAYQVTATGIYFAARTESGENAIQFLSFATGRTEALARIPKPFGNSFSVSPDGRYAIYPQVESSRNELMLVDNFR